MEKFNPYVILLKMHFLSGHTNKTETQPWKNWSPAFMYMDNLCKMIQKKKSQKKVISEKPKSSENAFV